MEVSILTCLKSGEQMSTNHASSNQKKLRNQQKILSSNISDKHHINCIAHHTQYKFHNGKLFDRSIYRSRKVKSCLGNVNLHTLLEEYTKRTIKIRSFVQRHFLLISNAVYLVQIGSVAVEKMINSHSEMRDLPTDKCGICAGVSRGM